MTKLVNITRCPKCAERGKDRKGNNLAEYANGFYCFSCGYKKTKRNLNNLKPVETLKNDGIGVSINYAEKLPTHALKWLLAYDLTMNEIANFKYAIEYEGKSSDLLVLYHDENYICARNFGNGAKYISKGVKPLLIYGEGDVVVLVEDIISAIKVARVTKAIPMLGAVFNKRYISALSDAKSIIIWGDRDKAVENVRQRALLAEHTGKPIYNVVTYLDPKMYNTEFITQIINSVN